MSAKVGNKNARKNTWCIIRGVSSKGKMEYQVSDDVVDRRTTSHDFDKFEDAQKFLKEVRTILKNGGSLESI